MEKFWELSLAIGGVSAIGAFIFYSLYKNWLSLNIFSKMTAKQTFEIMKYFLLLTFAVLIFFIIVYAVKSNPKQKQNTDTVLPVANNPPIPKIKSNKQNGTVPLKVFFDGIDSADPEGNKIYFKWMLNGHIISTEESFQHTFYDPGEYNIVLEVTDDNKKQHKASTLITASAAIVVQNPIQPPKEQRGKVNNIPRDTPPSKKYKTTIHAPDKSKIYIDGKLAGDTVLYTSLSEGMHEFLVKKDNASWKESRFIYDDGSRNFINIRDVEME